MTNILPLKGLKVSPGNHSADINFLREFGIQPVSTIDICVCDACIELCGFSNLKRPNIQSQHSLRQAAAENISSQTHRQAKLIARFGVQELISTAD